MVKMANYGIDISEHNGVINWSLARKNIEFCFIRGGYGKNNIDKKFYYNANGCKNNRIPFGIYWFSYALSIQDAINEATYVCNLADDYSPDLPIAFDWEYDSDRYAKDKGVNVTNSMREALAVAFLEEVIKRGYQPLLYTNPDYVHNKGFIKLINIYPLWLAQWGTNKPSIRCAYWQTSTQGSVNGINTSVDVDICYDASGVVGKDFSDIMEKAEIKYKNVAYDIIAGKYGTGSTRKKKLKEAGYDYDLAQEFVNRILE